MNAVWNDLALLGRKLDLIVFLAMLGLRKVHRRARLGLAWIPLNTLAHTVIISLILSIVFDSDKYPVYFGTSYAIWRTLSTTIMDGSHAWTSAARFIDNMALEPFMFIWVSYVRSFVVFGLNLVAVVAVLLIYGDFAAFDPLAFVLGCVLFYLNVYWIVLAIALLGTRFGDVDRLLPNLLFIVYVCTPILWETSRLGDKAYFAELNPFFHLIQVLRVPIIGGEPSAYSYPALTVMAVVGIVVATYAYQRSHNRIMFWLVR